ncbi:MAG: zinc ribbon domain-containing protein [Syntrophomonadaceae bacterium]|jgi:putative FmdB family regulatory protein|nr:zinc ribbon domain-containing protein [Syntrophomonadaceae bacterium]
MPTYDFLCTKCGQKFSQFLAIKDREMAACPGCGAKEARQLFTGFLYNKGGKSSASPGSGSPGGGCSASSCSGCSGC